MPEMSEALGLAAGVGAVAVTGMSVVNESHRASAGDPVTGMVVNPSTPVARSAKYFGSRLDFIQSRMGSNFKWMANEYAMKPVAQ